MLLSIFTLFVRSRRFPQISFLPSTVGSACIININLGRKELRERRKSSKKLLFSYVFFCTKFEKDFFATKMKYENDSSLNNALVFQERNKAAENLISCQMCPECFLLNKGPAIDNMRSILNRSLLPTPFK